MARVKVPSSETNLNLDLRQWAHKEATVLWKDKSVGVQRNAPHLQGGAGGSGQGSSGTLLFKGTSSWYPLWYEGRFFVLRDDETIKPVERPKPSQPDPRCNNCSACQSCNNYGFQCSCEGPNESILDEHEKNEDATNQPLKPVSLWCLGRSTDPIKQVFKKIHKEEVDRSEVYIYTAVVQGPTYSTCVFKEQPTLPRRTLDSVYLDHTLKTKLFKDIRDYIHADSRNYSLDRGIPYRRGYLLYGRPGCGKT
jgi:hypothetical protein